MSKDTTVIPLRQPGAIDDPLTEVAREGARRMLAQVLIAEADAFGRRSLRGGARPGDPVDAELGAGDREGGIDRHQRNSSSVRENICLAACMAG